MNTLFTNVKNWKMY